MADPSSDALVASAQDVAPPRFEWLLQRRALRQAEAQREAFDARSLASLGRARRALEVAERLLFGLEPLRAGDPSELVVELLGQSATWALAAAGGRAPGEGAAELAAAAAQAPGVAEFLTTARETGLFSPLLERTFGDRTGPVESSRRDAERAQPLVRRLVDRLDAELDAPRLVLARRRHRAVVVALLTACALGLALWLAHLRLAPTDLALGKPWSSSSAFGNYAMRGTVPRDRLPPLLFHTSSESSPWFQIDLQTPTRVGSLTVVNRLDCCQERALPLVVETSLNGSQWTQVARQTEVFDTWRPRFAPQQARFVRLRGDNTMLHLSQVAVFGP